MVKEAVTGIVNYGNKVLIGKKDPDREGFLKGKWHIPGETLEEGEDDKSALVRGIREEAGIEVVVRKFLASHKTPTHTEVRWYECFALSYNIRPSTDLVEVKWVPKKECINYCDKEAVAVWPQEILKYLNS